MSRRIVVVPDLHLPYEDRKVVRNFIKFIGEYQPDELVSIGDVMDFPQPSRWSKDTAQEFQGSVFLDCDYAKEKFFEPLRELYSGPFGVIEGNHDDRPRTYLARYAPALAESHEFDIDRMLDFPAYNVTWLPDFYDFTPGWTMTHGHKGGIRLSQIAGQTAFNAVQRFRKSVIMGHTHRLGVIPVTNGYAANGQTLVGMEVGNMCNMALATYLKGGTANWQTGFGVVTVDGDHVDVQAVLVNAEKFTVDGATYKLK